MKHWWFALALLTLAAPALAVNPDEMLKDPALEARAREISKDLRCVVCQNQSIDDSDAELARDLRLVVRERLGKGDSNKAVLDYVVARYGDFVLLKPPFQANTLALWLGPLVIIGLGVWAVLGFYRRRAQGSDAPKPLSAEENKRLAALLKDDPS